jgi:hypothetical protein
VMSSLHFGVARKPVWRQAFPVVNNESRQAL